MRALPYGKQVQAEKDRRPLARLEPFCRPYPPSPPTTKKPPNAATTAGNLGLTRSANPTSAPKSIPQKTCRLTLDLRRPAARVQE